MIDRALGLTPAQQQSYYFQLIPIFLSIVGKESELPSEGTTYRFSVSKGQQKFDENKFPIQANFNLVDGVPFMSVGSCKLNFFVPSFNRLRKQDFILRLIQNQRNQDYQVGEYVIDIGQLVESFKQEKKTRHQLKTFFSEDYELDFEIYIERNRITLEKVIKEHQAERSTKSPIKNSNEPSQKDQRKPVQDNKPQRDQPATPASVETKNQDPNISPSKNSVESGYQGSTESKEEGRRSEAEDRLENTSQRTGQKVPMIQTKFKQLAKQDTPSEIRLKESQRLSLVELGQGLSRGGEASGKEKVVMWLFLLLGSVVMYFAMHPNRRS